MCTNKCLSEWCDMFCCSAILNLYCMHMEAAVWNSVFGVTDIVFFISSILNGDLII